MQKRVCTGVLLLMMVMSVSLMGGNQAAIALEQKEQKAEEIQTRQLEETIELLENPEESKELAAKLKALLEARKRVVEGKEKAQPKRKATNLFKTIDLYKVQSVSAFEKAVFEIKALPQHLNQLRVFLFKKKSWEELFSLAAQFFLACLVGAITWFLFRKASKKMKAKLYLKEPFTLPKRIGGMFIDASLKVYPWVGLYVFIFVFFLIFPFNETVRDVILGVIPALILYSGLKHIFYFLLSPDKDEDRMIPIQDHLANYIFIWCRRGLLFSLWMYLIIIPCSILNRPLLFLVFSRIHKIGLVIMGAIILTQWKQPIENILCLKEQEEDLQWKRNLKRIFNAFSGNIYIVIIIYAVFIVALYVLGFSNTYTYLFQSTLKSIVVIFFGVGLWLLWGFFFKRLFQVSSAVKEKYPYLEKQVNQYVNFLGRGGYGVLVALAILTILDIWGFQTYEFVVSYGAFVRALIRIPLIIIGSIVLIQILYFLISNLEKQASARMLAVENVVPVEVEKRVETLGRIFRKASVVTIVTMTTMMVFAEMGFDIKPILAGAGIVGLAVGFGAQNLVRDVISGLFLIFENRIRVGDVAIINGTGGLVEQVNLRTTVLRSLDAVVHVFPNGSIDSLSNMTHEFSFYVFNVGIAYKEDVDRVIEVLKEVGADIIQDKEFSEFILEPIEILGLDQFADSAIVIKARIKTAPIKQWFVGREMNRRIKKRFDEEGIEIPFPHRTIYFGESNKSFSGKLEEMEQNSKKEES